MSWLRLFRSVALVTALLATSACIPVTVRKERVEPTITIDRKSVV
jgi:hypothetical protein